MALRSLLHISLFLTAFGILYHDTVAHTAGKWLTPEGSHGPLIVAVILYLLWTKRRELKAFPKSPAVLPGALLTCLGCFMLFAGKLSSTIVLQQISMIPFLLGAIWLLLGAHHLRALLIPVGYLIFMTGFLEEMLRNVAFHLQSVSAWIAARILALVGMPVFQAGTIIELPHISLEVVMACSGINHIVALLALAVPLAIMTQRNLATKCVLISSAFFIGIIANGFRVALIGLYSKYDPTAPLHGPNEMFRASMVFFLGMIVIFVVSYLLRRISPKPLAGGHSPVSNPSDNAGSETVDEPSRAGEDNKASWCFMPVITAGVIFLITFGFVHFYEPAPVSLKTPFQAFPAYISGFSGKPLEGFHERLRPFSGDEELLRIYEDSSGKRIELYIGYFDFQDREKKIIDYRRDWMHEEAQEISLGHASEPVMINKTRLRDRHNPADVYFWYFMDGRVITNRYVGKLATFWGALAKRKTNAAVIIIKTQNREQEVMPFLKELVPIVHAHLSGDQS